MGGSISVILVYFYHFSKTENSLPLGNFAIFFKLQCSFSPACSLSFVLVPTILHFFLPFSFYSFVFVFSTGTHVERKLKYRQWSLGFFLLCEYLQAENIHTTGVWMVRQAIAIKHQRRCSIWEQLHTLSKSVLCSKERKKQRSRSFRLIATQKVVLYCVDTVSVYRYDAL